MFKYLAKCLRGPPFAKRRPASDDDFGSDLTKPSSAISTQEPLATGQAGEVGYNNPMQTDAPSVHPRFPIGVGVETERGRRPWNEDNLAVVKNFFNLSVSYSCEECTCGVAKGSPTAGAAPVRRLASPEICEPAVPTPPTDACLATDVPPALQVSSDAAVSVSDIAPIMPPAVTASPEVPPPGLLPMLKARQASNQLAATSSEPLHFFAVYDGHGGEAASRHCADILHGNLLTILQAELQRVKSNDTHTTADQGVLPAGHYCLAVQKALRDAFIKTDEDFRQNSPDVHYHVGSTAVAALVGTHHIWTANVGDSRAVLWNGQQAVALSRDHKGSRLDEVERVEALGGVVVWDRVNGELAVTRAIGDTSYRPYVIAEPEVSQHSRTPDDALLVLASDGLWDVMGNNEVCQVALGALAKGWAEGTSTAQAAAETLVKSAMSRGTRDNVTTVVVDLKSAAFRGHAKGCARLQAQQQLTFQELAW